MPNVKKSQIERRESFRVDMKKEPIDIVWTDKRGNKHEKEIACLDFSKGGLKVDCDQAIELDVSATVIFKEASPNYQKLYGRIIRCIEQVNGCFEIALRLDETKQVVMVNRFE